MKTSPQAKPGISVHQLWNNLRHAEADEEIATEENKFRRASWWWFGKLRRRAVLDLKQAPRQGGVDRPYQDHLGGLDKAYERPLNKFFKGLLEAF